MKKLGSFIVYIALAAAVVLPLAVEDSHAAFSPRTEMPEYTSQEGRTYYYTDNNVFYKHGLGPNKKYLQGYEGYCTGNCTWYAYGRASEILGTAFNTSFRWSASSWWKINQEGNYYSYGSTPEIGAIACYSTHVAIVEDVVGGEPYVSESAWTISEKKPKKASKLSFHYGTPWQKDLLGYIYITKPGINKVKKVDYSVIISIDDLNMRTGPGIDYNSAGYAAKDTYKVDQESGKWLRLADSGYWVYGDYAARVSSDAPAVLPEKENDKKPDKESLKGPEKESVNEPEKEVSKDSSVKKSSAFKVKVKARDLNMRKGPGKKYKRMGYVKRGTYVITKTKNGWGKLKKNGYWIKLSYTKKI